MTDTEQPSGEKQTTSLRMAWVSLALVAAVVVMFVTVVLPQVKPHPRAGRGTIAPEFVLPVIYNGERGNRVRLSDLKGSAVVIDFWASWCAPCREQAPIVDAVARRYRDKSLVVLGIDTGDERDAAVRFAQSHGLSYAALFDEGDVAAAYHVDGLPTLVVIDRNGRIVAIRRSVVQKEDLEQLVDEALAG